MFLPSILLYALLCMLQFAGATTLVRRQQPPLAVPAGGSVVGGLNLIIAAVQTNDVPSFEIHLTPAGMYSNRYSTNSYFIGEGEGGSLVLKHDTIDPLADERMLFRVKISQIHPASPINFKHMIAASMGTNRNIQEWLHSDSGVEWLKLFVDEPAIARQEFIKYGRLVERQMRLGADVRMYKEGIAYYDPVTKSIDADNLIDAARQRTFYTGHYTESKPKPFAWGESEAPRRPKFDVPETPQKGLPAMEAGPSRGPQGPTGPSRGPQWPAGPSRGPQWPTGPSREPQGPTGPSPPMRGQGSARPHPFFKPGEYPDITKMLINPGTPQTGARPNMEPPAGAGLNRPSAGAGLNRPSAGAGWNRPSAGAGLNRPSMGAGWNRPSAGAGLNRPSAGDMTSIEPGRTIIRPQIEASGGAQAKPEQGEKKKGAFRRFIDKCRK